jgi:cysteine desulfurase/selenocysteine lyase
VTGLDVERVRKDFPILSRVLPNGRPLVYLDSSNTAQKPLVVLDTVREFYEQHNANVARAIHTLGAEATEAYENSRVAVGRFIGATDEREVVFTRNSTEALNLLARSIADSGRLGPGREVLVTEMEHHSNLVPWQLACERTGATLRWVGLTDDGRLDLANLDELLTERTAVFSFVHMSNILGTLNPAAFLAQRARAVGALSVLDASQSVPHLGVDVRELGVDALAFTGHKALGPTGIGVLWARLGLLEALPPFLGGGEMIEEVTMARSTYAAPPHKFEAGTPPIAQAIGLGAAVGYLSDLGMDAVAAHEAELTGYALGALAEVPGLRIVGPRTNLDRGGIISFTLADLHPHDVGQVLDDLGIAVRVGHHCARPVCLRYGVPATTRASVHVYTTTGEIDALVEGLHHVLRFFR